MKKSLITLLSIVLVLVLVSGCTPAQPTATEASAPIEAVGWAGVQPETRTRTRTMERRVIRDFFHFFSS